MSKKTSFKVVVSIFLILVLAVPTSANGFVDMPNNWAREPLEKAVSNGLLKGDHGQINPNGNLTRAELATILNRALGISKKANISNFTDVKEGQWYHEELAKAVGAGLLQGDKNKLNPNDPVTREQAFLIVSRALEIQGKTKEHLGFKDGSQVAGWAKEGINGLIEAGYLKGDAGKINPKGNITRAEYASLMGELVGGYITEAGIHDKAIEGNVLIKSPKVELKGLKINGDLIIAEGALDDLTVLNGVEVTGRILVRGGGEVALENNSRANNIVVANRNRVTDIVVDKSSQVSHMDLKTQANISGEGKVASVYVAAQAENSKIATKDTKIDKGENIATGKEETTSGTSSGRESSGGGGGGGGSSSGGGSSNNDKDTEEPSKPGDSKTTIKPGGDGEATVEGNHLKEVILDGQFTQVTVNAPNAHVIIAEGTRVDELIINAISSNALYIEGIVANIHIQKNLSFNIKFSKDSNNITKITRNEEAKKRTINITSENTFIVKKDVSDITIKVVDGEIKDISSVDNEFVGLISFKIVDGDGIELDEAEVKLKRTVNDTPTCVQGITSTMFWTELGTFEYTVSLEGYETVIDKFEIKKMGSYDCLVILTKSKDLTEKSKLLNDINRGLDIIDDIIEINKRIGGTNNDE